MSNVMSLQKFKNKASRNGFDLSCKNAFTAKVGELLPVLSKECIPGDKFKINTQWFTRTQPVNTAAYTRIKEYYDFFFVPTNLLWDKFNTFVTHMVDNNQSANGITASTSLGDQHPYFTSMQLAYYMGRCKDSNSQPLKNFFGYNRSDCTNKLLSYLDYGDMTDFNKVNPVALSPWKLLAYQKIYQDYYRNSQWEKAYAPAWNLNYIKGTNDLNIPVSSIEGSATENMFDLRYCNWNKDYFMGVQPNTQFGAPASINLDSSTFNINQGNTSDWTTQITAANYNQDSAAPVNVVNTNGHLFNIVSPNNNNSDFVFDSSSLKSLRSSLGLSGSATIQGGFTILALRQAEAKQKWQEITQSQQQDYKSQIDAHFGVKVSDAYSTRCKYIGGTSNNLDISEVVNNNITGDNDASVAGKGVGVGNGFIEFESQTHGVLMCIYHAVPLLDYAISGIDKMNLKTNWIDYAIPEFDKLGAVEIDSLEIMQGLSSEINSTSWHFGYVPRYADYKTSIDRVHGAFKDTLGFWVAPFSDAYIRTYLSNLKKIVNYPTTLTYNFFKVNPGTLDPIFGVNADSTTATDQLLVNAAFDIKAVRNLDYNGLPY